MDRAGQQGLELADLVGKMPCCFCWAGHTKQGMLNGSFVDAEECACLCNYACIFGYTVKEKHMWQALSIHISSSWSVLHIVLT